MSIEDKYDEVRQLITIGKEKGYLLYDEVNELLPSEITSSDELDDLFNTFGSAGIEVVDSDQKYPRTRRASIARRKAPTNSSSTSRRARSTRPTIRSACTCARWAPCPLLTREGEVEIAKRIERGKLAVIKSISRTPTIAAQGHRRWAISCTTGERDDPRAGHLHRRGADRREASRIASARCCGRSRRCARRARSSEKSQEKLETTPKGATRGQAQVPPRRAGRRCARASSCRSCIRAIEFTEASQAPPDRRDQGSVEAVQRVQREIDNIERSSIRRLEEAEAEGRRPQERC